MSNEPFTENSPLFSLVLVQKDTNYTDHRLSTVTEPATGTIMEIPSVLVSIPIDSSFSSPRHAMRLFAGAVHRGWTD